MSWFNKFLNKAQGNPEDIAKKWMEENPEAVADFITNKQREELDVKAQAAIDNLPAADVEIKNEEIIDLDKLNDEIAGK